MTCPLCSRRPAKRACPALEQRICPTCCATKRLVEIRCPSDCPHLEAAQRHPAAAVRRQQEQDLVALVGNMAQRLSEPQLQLLFLFASIIVRHKPGGLVPLVDADVAEAASAAAGTLEAASRGLIAELTASSRVADGLRRELMAFVSEVGKGGGSLFEREAAEVLRGIERGARHEGPGPRGDGWPADTAYLSLLSRVLPPASRDREEERSSIVLP